MAGPAVAKEPITRLLADVERGDAAARERLWSIVHAELRVLAHGKLRNEHHRSDLQTTLLVNEAYLRLVGNGHADFANRRHFFAAAAECMRRILVDDARRRSRQKRGGDCKRAPLSDYAVQPAETDPAELLALDEGLRRLHAIDARKARIVELRYFIGLSIDETADVMGVSPRLVDKEWSFARVWLHRELTGHRV